MNFLCFNILCYLFIFFSIYLFVLLGGEVYIYDRVNVGGLLICVNYRYVWGRENFFFIGKTMGKREKS